MRGRGTFDPELLTSFFWLFLLFTAVILGAAFIQRIRKLYFETDAPEDLLATLQKAFEEGDLDKDEFKRVQVSLEQSLAPQSLIDDDQVKIKKPVVDESIRELD